jgi:hypothetical protein
LTTGRVLDTTRLREKAGFTPAFTTLAAFDDFVGRLKPAVDARAIRGVEVRVASAIGVPARPAGPWRSRAAVAVGAIAGASLDEHNQDETQTVAPTASATAIPPTPPRRLFSIDGEAIRSSTVRSPRPGSRKK